MHSLGDCNLKSNIISQGYDATFTPAVPNALNSQMYLLGTGMRRRRIVIDFDVYQIGVAVSHHALSKAIQWNTARKYEGGPLSTYILQKEPTIANRVQVAISLRMKRGVSKAQFIEAFREAFVGVQADAFAAFEGIIEKCLGEAGVKTGEEVIFYWLNNGELVFVKNGEVAGSLKIEEISRRLLDVYTDPSRTVSKELYDCIEKNIEAVGTQVFH
jgi:hypothetical protein